MVHSIDKLLVILARKTSKKLTVELISTRSQEKNVLEHSFPLRSGSRYGFFFRKKYAENSKGQALLSLFCRCMRYGRNKEEPPPFFISIFTRPELIISVVVQNPQSSNLVSCGVEPCSVQSFMTMCTSYKLKSWWQNLTCLKVANVNATHRCIVGKVLPACVYLE